MNIEKVTSEDLRRMENQEGLILQGCGGDLNEWVDGINQMLTANGCLREGTQFQKGSLDLVYTISSGFSACHCFALSRSFRNSSP